MKLNRWNLYIYLIGILVIVIPTISVVSEVHAPFSARMSHLFMRSAIFFFLLGVSLTCLQKIKDKQSVWIDLLLVVWFIFLFIRA